MVAGGVEGGLFVHVVDSDGAAGAVAGVGAGTVPGERVMKVDMALLDRADRNIEGMIFKAIGHRAVTGQIAQEAALVAPLLRTGHHVHTAVVIVGIIQRDPGADLGMFGHQRRPSRRILVPVQPPAERLRFVLDLVVPHPQFTGVGQLGGHRGDLRVHDQFFKGGTGFKDVDNLPDRRCVIARQVATEDGLGNVSAFAIVDYA